MKVKEFSKYYIVPLCCLLLILSSCAAEKSGMVATVYHNTTARYNAYFYASQQMDEIQASVIESQENNFNDVLRIYPEVDTSLINTLEPQMEECIKKASIAIERHPNSKWTDDSYILIGQCRLYNRNFGDAIKTFKYVNTNSEDDEARHRALIKLMRTFIEAQEQNNAIAVSDYLRKEKLNRINKANYYLTRAHLSQINEDFSTMVGNLLLAASLLKNDEGRARTYFIIGQVYQQLGFDAQAYENYEEVLRSNPEYELYFYARLNMAQVYDLSRENDIRKIRKYFRKLLRDKKNEEFQDKIYYEMAAFEQKQGKLDEAIELYNKSVQSSISNNRQKAYAYLSLGRIYYDDKKDYELAKLYYDSTMTVLPPDEDEYEAIADRQQVLEDFVTQLNIINEQDSLLALASMDSLELSAYLDEVIAEEDRLMKERQQLLERNKRRSRNAAANNVFGQADTPFGEQSASAGSGENWYFYSPSAISVGRTAFVRRWGNRPLEDNWRRSEKTIEGNFAQDDAVAVDAAENIPSIGPVTENTADQRREEYYADIPLTPEARSSALGLVEEAYYKLGGIYNFDLQEKANAIEAFETMLSRFPESEYRPEVLYELYLLYKESGSEEANRYKNTLIREYPESIFAKILENPNYREESSLASEKLKSIYSEAYELYKAGDYEQAARLVDAGLEEYGENDFVDNMVLLRALIRGKTTDSYQYQLSLQNFLEEYPESDVYAYAEDLLKKSQEFKENEAKRRGPDYRELDDSSHSFIVLYENKENLSVALPEVINAFNADYPDGPKLQTANLMLEDGQVMIIVEKFSDKASAMAYFKRFSGAGSPLQQLSEPQRNALKETFVIAEDNLNELYQTRAVEEYLLFFRMHYI